MIHDSLKAAPMERMATSECTSGTDVCIKQMPVMTPTTEGKQLRLAVIGHMDPLNYRFWSGIPLNLVNNLRAAGHDVATVGPLEPRTNIIERVKGRFYRHACKTVYLVNRNPQIFRKRSKQASSALLRMDSLDAIIATYPPDLAFLETNVPIILVHDATWRSLLDFYPGYERHRLANETVEGGEDLECRALDRCAAIIYASNWAASSAIRDYGVDPAKITVFPLGACLPEPPERQQVTEALERRDGTRCRLLFVGLEWHRKGGDIAVGVTRALRDAGLDAVLDVVGAQPTEAMPDFVNVHGKLLRSVPDQRERFDNLFLNADFFLLPTRAECQGMVFCEAAAYAVPALAHSVGGTPDVVRHGQSGWLFPPLAAPQAFADRIATIFNNRRLYNQMAMAAREDFEARLNWPAFCAHLASVVKSVQPGAAIEEFQLNNILKDETQNRTNE
jgi:glycosyltransferase involved in cell wall biosynthesis